MTVVNKGDFFEVKIFGQYLKGDLKTWLTLIQIQNISIDGNYFNEVMEQLYGKDVAYSYSGYFIAVDDLQKEADLEAFCTKEAEKILTLLARHPLWGEAGGPELGDDYSTLD